MSVLFHSSDATIERLTSYKNGEVSSQRYRDFGYVDLGRGHIGLIAVRHPGGLLVDEGNGRVCAHKHRAYE